MHRVLSQPGRPLTDPTAQSLGRNLGVDPGNVVVHADGAAAQSAADVAANAYTVGNHIVFGAGRFAPATGQGRQLLVHELTHVVQAAGNPTGPLTIGDPHSAEEHEAENMAGNRRPAHGASNAVLRRDPVKAAPAPKPTPPAPAQAVFHLVVRDQAINLGGGKLVPDLEAAKQTLMARKVSGEWTLVLSIHSSDKDRVAAQEPPNWQDGKFYDKTAINTLFNGDAAFVAWRNQFGPTRVVLYGCQVNADFEQVIADSLSRGGKGRTAQGLGPGCKPASTARYFSAKTRREFAKLPTDEQQKMTAEVQAENRTFGHYGEPPVPDDKVLDYLFDGAGKGEWASVELEINGSTPKPPIPYWNRTSDPRFLHSCDPINPLRREHIPITPPLMGSAAPRSPSTESQPMPLKIFE